jgi:Na+/melibiose symporter-like transporter
MIGAFFNPVMGIIADRTRTRWGKFRPWILWTAIPFGAVAMLAFLTPAFSPGGKAAYALITYIFLVITYSANNLPYASLRGVLTGDMAERNSISSYRFVAVMIAQFIVQGLLMPLVLILGDSDKPNFMKLSVRIMYGWHLNLHMKQILRPNFITTTIQWPILAGVKELLTW